jgi:uncharacterized repeat protein (TIGR01451 family)
MEKYRYHRGEFFHLLRRKITMNSPTVLTTTLLAGSLLLNGHEALAAGTTQRVSVDSFGLEDSSGSYYPAVSADARFVAFHSNANHMVTGDTNGVADIFVRDRRTGQTSRVSVRSNGAETNNDSFHPFISADGRFVAFYSIATNLVRGDTNRDADIFVHDRQTGQTTRVSISSSGAQANGGNFDVALSADGRFVAFHSDATNLVRGDTNGATDVFVHDRQTGQTARVNAGLGGAEPNGASKTPAISADGRYVAFFSEAKNLVPRDTNGRPDIFVRDRQTGETTRVSIGPRRTETDGHSLAPTISADGRYVAFASEASNLVRRDTNADRDIFVHDRNSGQTTRVSVNSSGAQGNNNSYHPVISADGRFVAFYSDAANLVPGDTNKKRDIFAHNRITGTTTRVSVSAGGSQANGNSNIPTISADGRFVAFYSAASNLVPGDTNTSEDIFIRDQLLDPAVSADLALAGSDTPDPIQIGGTLTYTFTVNNNGADQATGAILVDVLSSNLTLNSVTSSQGTCNKAHVLVCRLGNLATGSNATVTVNAKVRSAAPRSLGNTASALASPRDAKLANNRKEVKTAVTP